MSESSNDKERRPSEKEIIRQLREQNPILWDEIAKLMELLEECGVRSYKLTGSVQDPVIVSYRLT